MLNQELVLFQENHITTRKAAARRLRNLADKIENMNFKMGDYPVSLPEQIALKIEYEAAEEAAGGELEIEILWSPWEKMGPSGMAD